MKLLLTLTTTLFISFSASASSSDLACVVGYGNYNEVEKFQIIDEQYVAIGNQYLDSACSTNSGVLKCTFANNRIRPYYVTVNLNTLQGVIKQTLRSEHRISCQKI